MDEQFEVVEMIAINGEPRQACFMRPRAFISVDKAIDHAQRCQRGIFNDPHFHSITYVVRDMESKKVCYESSAMDVVIERRFNEQRRRMDKGNILTPFEYQAMVDPYMDTLDVDGYPQLDEPVGPDYT